MGAGDGAGEGRGEEGRRGGGEEGRSIGWEGGGVDVGLDAECAHLNKVFEAEQSRGAEDMSLSREMRGPKRKRRKFISSCCRCCHCCPLLMGRAGGK